MLTVSENGYASPLLAEDHTGSGLPPASIMFSEFDALRDDGSACSQKLRDAGVSAVSSMQHGHAHITVVGIYKEPSLQPDPGEKKASPGSAPRLPGL